MKTCTATDSGKGRRIEHRVKKSISLARINRLLEKKNKRPKMKKFTTTNL